MPRGAIFVGLTYVALSRPGVAYDYHVARVSILVATTALALLAFLRWLRAPAPRTLAWAMAANVVCLLVSDQAILLLPAEAILWAARGRRADRVKTAMLAGVDPGGGGVAGGSMDRVLTARGPAGRDRWDDRVSRGTFR